MTAIIDGVTVVGTPEEINELIRLRGGEPRTHYSNTPNFPNTYSDPCQRDDHWRYNTGPTCEI
jgi:hypothetical protein